MNPEFSPEQDPEHLVLRLVQESFKLFVNEFGAKLKRIEKQLVVLTDRVTSFEEKLASSLGLQSGLTSTRQSEAISLRDILKEEITAKEQESRLPVVSSVKPVIEEPVTLSTSSEDSKRSTFNQLPMGSQVSQKSPITPSDAYVIQPVIHKPLVQPSTSGQRKKSAVQKDKKALIDAMKIIDAL